MSEAPYQPQSLEAVQEHILTALEAGEALEVRAGGSKRGYGRPLEAARVLDVSALAGVVDYQPHELILVARPGTRLAELEALLSGQGQQFAFEPPHWGEAATLGGALACNLSGPRRFKAGAARDHLLGFTAVTGRGEVVRGGGRVVKNVTGYDLSKLMCGSFGTLAVMTEVVVKVLPGPETERTVLFAGRSDPDGLAILRAAAASSHEPGGLAHLPPGTVPGGAAGALANGGALTAIRVEGPGPSMETRAQSLAAGGGGPPEFLEPEDSRAFWRELRELTPLPTGPDSDLWRFSIAPTAGGGLGEQLRAQGASSLVYDWGGALLWAVLPATLDPAGVHQAAQAAGGHARLVRGDDPRQGREAAFGQLSPGKHRINLNLKLAFDPGRILNPGRMFADI